jgi:hypothetical protein
MKPLVRPGIGRITLQSSTEYLNQLRVRIDRGELLEPITAKPSIAASEAVCEIGSESDRQFVETRD